MVRRKKKEKQKVLKNSIWNGLFVLCLTKQRGEGHFMAVLRRKREDAGEFWKARPAVIYRFKERERSDKRTLAFSG